MDAVLELAGRAMASERLDPSELLPESVRLPGDLVEMVRYICFHSFDGKRRMKLSTYLEGLLRPLVVRDYEATRKRVTEEERGQKPRKS